MADKIKVLTDKLYVDIQEIVKETKPDDGVAPEVDVAFEEASKENKIEIPEV